MNKLNIFPELLENQDPWVRRKGNVKTLVFVAGFLAAVIVLAIMNSQPKVIIVKLTNPTPESIVAMFSNPAAINPACGCTNAAVPMKAVSSLQFQTDDYCPDKSISANYSTWKQVYDACMHSPSCSRFLDERVIRNTFSQADKKFYPRGFCSNNSVTPADQPISLRTCPYFSNFDSSDLPFPEYSAGDICTYYSKLLESLSAEFSQSFIFSPSILSPSGFQTFIQGLSETLIQKAALQIQQHLALLRMYVNVDKPLSFMAYKIYGVEKPVPKWPTRFHESRYSINGSSIKDMNPMSFFSQSSPVPAERSVATFQDAYEKLGNEQVQSLMIFQDNFSFPAVINLVSDTGISNLATFDVMYQSSYKHYSHDQTSHKTVYSLEREGFWDGLACEKDYATIKERRSPDGSMAVKLFCFGLDTYLRQTAEMERLAFDGNMTYQGEQSTNPFGASGIFLMRFILRNLTNIPIRIPRSPRSSLLTTAWIMAEETKAATAKSSNYAQYVNRCAPSECSYSESTTPPATDIAAILLGLIGGVGSALKVIVPLLVDLVMDTMGGGEPASTSGSESDKETPKSEHDSNVNSKIELSTQTTSRSPSIANSNSSDATSSVLNSHVVAREFGPQLTNNQLFPSPHALQSQPTTSTALPVAKMIAVEESGSLTQAPSLPSMHHQLVSTDSTWSGTAHAHAPILRADYPKVEQPSLPAQPLAAGATEMADISVRLPVSASNETRVQSSQDISVQHAQSPSIQQAKARPVPPPPRSNSAAAGAARPAPPPPRPKANAD
jgi:hypothetical protein